MRKGSGLRVEHSTRGHLADLSISQMAFSERLPPFGSVFSYLFSNPANQLDFDPSYPKNPRTFWDYIRKFRKDKGVSQVDLAKMIGVNEMTIVNWETRGMVPRIKKVRERLAREVEGAGKWLVWKNIQSLTTDS